MMRLLFDPGRWRLRHYLAVVLILSIFNLFGPKSFIHLFHLKKQAENLGLRKKELSVSLEELQENIRHFQQSEFEQKRAIRTHLGYLGENEVSVEFNNGH